MRKLVLATSVAVFSLSASAHAADMEYEQQLGLIVSGVADQWMGAQFNSGPLVDGSGLTGDDTLFTTGGEGLLELALGRKPVNPE
jgi:opacity protein-like surface antigen